LQILRILRGLSENVVVNSQCDRRANATFMVHSDQGSRFNSYDSRDFVKAQNLEQSMSRRRNFHENAVAESFQATETGAPSPSDLRHPR
jgi:putative transposase